LRASALATKIILAVYEAAAARGEVDFVA